MSSPKNPWVKVSSKEIYKNPWISVREDSVIRPDGKPGIYGVIEPKLAVGVLAVDEQENIFLVGQYRYTIDYYSWEIIEGGGELDEDALETAKRELREEAGLTAENWSKLCPDVYLSNSFSTERAVFYLAKGLRETEPSPDGTEVLELRKEPLSEVLEMVRSGEINDSMSVIAVNHYALRKSI